MDSLVDSPFQLRHEIFALDAYLQGPLDRAQRKSHATRFIQSILQVLSMEPLGTLQFHDAVDDRAPGWSFIQAITTSHISCHYFQKPGRKPHVRIDLYSCQSVDWRRIIELIHQYLDLEEWRGTFVERYLDDEGERKIFTIRGYGERILEEECILDGTISTSRTSLRKVPVSV